MHFCTGTCRKMWHLQQPDRNLARMGLPHPRQISVEVPQGVGDIWWIHQKLYPYYDKINYDILILDDKCPLQKRSAGFVELFPNVGNVKYKLVTQAYYDDTWDSYYDIGLVMEAGKSQVVQYACNLPLEHGVRLEAIDPGYDVSWHIAPRCDYCPLAFDKFITLYVSGSVSKIAEAWKPQQWSELVRKLYWRYGLSYPVVLIGAGFDLAMVHETQRLLRSNGLKTEAYISAYPGNVCYIIKKSLMFIGYQSGLSVLADSVNTPQIMMYLPKLKSMLYSWAKQENIGSKLYQAFLFSQSIDSVLESYVLRIRQETK